MKATVATFHQLKGRGLKANEGLSGVHQQHGNETRIPTITCSNLIHIPIDYLQDFIQRALEEHEENPAIGLSDLVHIFC
mgnify:CR=1 FL=1